MREHHGHVSAGAGALVGGRTPILAAAPDDPATAYAVTGSALATSTILLALTVPALLFGSVAGVYVDRWDRRRIMVVANLARLVGPSLGAATLALVLSLGLLVGFPAVGFYVGTQTVLQRRVADEYRGRVFGALQALNAALSVTTLAVAGALADVVSVRRLLYLVVALWSVTVLLAWWRLRLPTSVADHTAPEPTNAGRSAGETALYAPSNSATNNGK